MVHSAVMENDTDHFMRPHYKKELKLESILCTKKMSAIYSVVAAYVSEWAHVIVVIVLLIE